MPVLRTEQITEARRKQVFMSKLRKNFLPKPRSSGTVIGSRGGPACSKCFSNNCPQMTLWVRLPLPLPILLQWTPVSNNRGQKGLLLHALHLLSWQPTHKKGGVMAGPEEVLLSIPYLTYKEVPKKVPSVLVSACSTCGNKLCFDLKKCFNTC